MQARSFSFSAFNLLAAWELPVCGAVSRPVTGGRTVYLFCEHGFVFALDPEAAGEGQLLWRHKLELPPIMRPVPVGDGVLLGLVSREVEILGGAQGKVSWSYKPKLPRPKKVLIEHPFSAAYEPPWIYVVYEFGLAVLEAESGREARFRFARRGWRRVAADAGRLFLIDEERGIIEAESPENTRPLWHYVCPAGIAQPLAIDQDVVYCAGRDGCLHVVEIATGRARRVVPLGAVLSEPPLIGEEALYLISDEHGLQALDLRTLAGSSPDEADAPVASAWTFQPPGCRLGSPLLFGEGLFTAADDGRIFGLDAASGELFWQTKLASGGIGLGCAGDVLVAALRDRVVGFRPPPGFGGKPRDPAAPAGPRPPDPAAPVARHSELPPLVTRAPPGVDLMLREPERGTVERTLRLPGSVAGEIAADDRRVYLPCADDVLIAIDLQTAAVAWRIGIDEQIRGRPELSGERLAVASERSVRVVEAATGRLVWRHRSSEEIAVAPAMSSAIVGYCAGARVVGLDAGSGERRWESELGEILPLPPCAGPRDLYVATPDGVSALALGNGRERWSSPALDKLTGPSVHGGGRLVAGCRDHHVYAFDAETGRLLWTLETRGEVRHAAAFLPGDRVGVVSLDRWLYALDAADGSRIWRLELDGLPQSPPCVVDSTLYVATTRHGVYAVDVASGRLRGKHDFAQQGLAAGPTAAGRAVVVVTTDNRLICLRPLRPD